MAYADSIAHDATRVRYILKIDGVPYYFGIHGDGSATYDDSDTHGELTVLNIMDLPSVSGGRLDHKANRHTGGTCRITLQDSATLRSLFSRRGNVQYTATSITSSGTTLDIGSTSGMAIDDYIHVGTETVQIDAVVDGDTLTVDRGKLGTIARRWAPGTPVSSTAPRSWKGRRAQLALGVESQSGASWDYQDPYRTLWIEDAPRFQDGTWSFSGAYGLEQFNRPFYVGQPDVGLDRVAHITGENVVRFYPYDMASFDDGGTMLYIKLQYYGAEGIFPVSSISGTYISVYPNEQSVIGDPITVDQILFGHHYTNGLAQGLEDSAEYHSDTEASMRAVFKLPANPAVAALQVMLSNLGDGTASATYDLLPGVEATEQRNMVRAGAGLTTNQVDLTSWELAREFYAPAYPFFVLEQENLLDFLCKDVAPMIGGYVYVNSAGKIAFQRYEPATAAQSYSTTFTTSSPANCDCNNAQDSEKSILGSVKISCDYDWANKEFLHEHKSYYLNAHKMYGDIALRTEVASRFAGANYNDVLSIFDNFVRRWGEGAQRYTLNAKWREHMVNVGDTVKLTLPTVPDFEGGQGIANKVCEVVTATPGLDRSEMQFELVARPTGKLLAPSGEVTHKYTATSFDVDPQYATSGYDPTDEWAVGWKVVFHDPTTGVIKSAGGSSVATLSVVTASGVEFTGGPTDVAVDDIMTMADYDDADSTAANSASGAGQPDHAFISDDPYNPALDGDAADHWL